MGVVEGRDQDQDEVVQWEATQGSNGGQEKIFVSVRVRPINSKENESNDFADWECINSTTILFKNCLSERSAYPNSYTFDRVFGFGSSTRQVYEEAAKEVALSVLNGVNSSVFAYGQTSSGKTYTMGGITQYAISDLYDYIYKHEEREYLVKFGAMEIYNEHVKDLLSTDPSPLRLLDDPEKGTVVEKLTEEIVRDKSHLLELIAVCEAQRQIGETSLNETSSRSHQILRLTVESTPRQLARGNSSMLTASVNFVDLAGSERTSQTQARGTRLKEGSHINRSLLTLGKCIRSLSKGRNGHIPYRDSKLTRILQNSLGGNARTAIICTMSPAHSHLEQSRNTLLFASCAKQVTTNAQVNVVMSDKALVKQLRKELARLERELTGVSLVSSKGDVVTVLKEKELQIEKMGKEMRELSRQRDYAQSRVEELLSSGKRTMSTLSRESGSRPQSSDSRRSLSWVDDSSLTSDTSDYQRLDVEQLARSESLKFLQENEGFDLISHHRELLENFDDNLIPDVFLPQELNQTAPNPSGSPSPQWEDITTVRKPDSQIEDKEVCCIEVQAPDIVTITQVPAPVKTFSLEEEKERFNDEDGEIEREKEKRNEVEKEEEKEKKSANENREPSEKKEEAKSVENEAEYDALVKRINELQMTIDCLVRRNSSGSTESDGSNPKKLSITRSMSCKATLTSSKLMNHERLEDLPRVLDVNDDGKRKLTRLGNSMSMKNPSMNEVEDVKCSELSETFDISSFDAKINADAELEPDKPTELQVNGTIAEEVKEEVKEEVREEVKEEVEEEVKKEIRAEVKEEVTVEVKEEVKEEFKEKVEEETVDEPKESKSGENIADDSVASTTVESQMSWEEEFESQRSKIIELWHACHTPLVHRTCFFLLFKGDASDKVYMDVELRRLSFILNRFSKGQKIALDGQAFTQSSSMKALNQERDVLVKQVYKKIPSQERETLFRKWGIDMNSKQRRIQLARCIWTDPKDMEHIKESATLVARLIDFTDENQMPKEMFVGPSITPKSLNRRTYSWKTSMSSVAQAFGPVL